MKRMFVALSFFLFSQPAQADVRVTLDLAFARQVLSEVCSGRSVDSAAISHDPVVLQMLAHFSQFRDYFTLDAYLDARHHAANCIVPTRDIFRFEAVIENRVVLKALLDDLEGKAAAYSGAVSGMLAPYTPEGLSYSGLAVPVIGSPSCGGWSKGATFYVDLPCISGDPEGLKYLIAHESYHGMQDQFMWDAAEAHPVSRLLGEVLREGSATAFADFAEIQKPGDYAALNLRVIKVNGRRSAQNFDLLDMAVQYVASQEGGYDAANNIGLSGAYDSPFYYVGVTMIRAVETVSGRSELMRLLASPPEHVFAHYRSLTDADGSLPKLGPVLTAWLEEMLK